MFLHAVVHCYAPDAKQMVAADWLKRCQETLNEFAEDSVQIVDSEGRPYSLENAKLKQTLAGLTRSAKARENKYKMSHKTDGDKTMVILEGSMEDDAEYHDLVARIKSLNTERGKQRGQKKGIKVTQKAALSSPVPGRKREFDGAKTGFTPLQKAAASDNHPSRARLEFGEIGNVHAWVKMGGAEKIVFIDPFKHEASSAVAAYFQDVGAKLLAGEDQVTLAEAFKLDRFIQHDMQKFLAQYAEGVASLKDRLVDEPGMWEEAIAETKLAAYCDQALATCKLFYTHAPQDLSKIEELVKQAKSFLGGIIKKQFGETISVAYFGAHLAKNAWAELLEKIGHVGGKVTEAEPKTLFRSAFKYIVDGAVPTDILRAMVIFDHWETLAAILDLFIKAEHLATVSLRKTGATARLVQLKDRMYKPNGDCSKPLNDLMLCVMLSHCDYDHVVELQLEHTTTYAHTRSPFDSHGAYEQNRAANELLGLSAKMGNQ